MITVSTLKILCLILCGLCTGLCFSQSGASGSAASSVSLPPPKLSGEMSVEAALNQRRSVRHYSDAVLNLNQISQLCWSAQGITKKMAKPFWFPKDREWIGGLRTAPSAGALYPLEIYLVIGKAEGLSTGLYKYIPSEHSLERIHAQDLRQSLTEAALNQEFLNEAGMVMVIAGFYSRSSPRYGDRARRYVDMEAGAVCQNIALQCESLRLGTVYIGAFEDEKVKQVLGLSEDESPLAIMPVGVKRQE